MSIASSLASLLPRRLRSLPQAPVLGLHAFGHSLLLLMAALLWLYAQQGQARPLAQWVWLDIVGEGGMALMVGVWLVYVRASRPAGPVTSLLCLGLAGMLLGGFVDTLDEFWVLPKSVLWDNALESTLTPLGMVLLTCGLHQWRREQLVLNAQLHQRERLFRDHRRVDGLTQLGDAGYMAQQLLLERAEGREGSLLMLGWQGFEAVARRHGLAEADRLLQAAAQLLLLHLRGDALLCRYAGDRFIVLLPGLAQSHGDSEGQVLREALAGFAYPLPGGERLRLPVLMARVGTSGPTDPQELLAQLAGRLA
ncbi:GGDEF domain-containing protein [Roseateles cavernae]|uniref:GGDEF domain-containing protein n=1 Tax=Roseateles cavernae TaxID=3153578 RepID=UPI0032E3E67A